MAAGVWWSSGASCVHGGGAPPICDEPMTSCGAVAASKSSIVNVRLLLANGLAQAAKRRKTREDMFEGINVSGYIISVVPGRTDPEAPTPIGPAEEGPPSVGC